MNTPANILLVDDEVRNLDALESFLQSEDYTLVRALTAEEALRELLDGEFAVLVLDIQMPGMSGIELANLIKQRKRTQHIPIIFLTAYYQGDEDVLAGYSTGAVDYLTKPVNPQILKSKIGVFVDLFRKTRALAATNVALETEIAQRQAAEEALRRSNAELETRVRARTADLLNANEELRQREAALRTREAEAHAASRAKDDFLATLSHELRTPLNPVLLLASEGAHNAELPEAVRHQFALISQNVTLEARLIDDLLDLTAISRGKLALSLGPVNVHSALQEAVQIVSAEISRKGVSLTLALQAARPELRGDDMRLKQVFWNIIKNAVKFTPDGGCIHISTAQAAAANDLVVTVTDSGIGMTEEELNRVFEAFAQGDHATSARNRRYGGMGLGLAISRTLIELHGGSIRALSAGRDQGTTVIIHLPLAVAAAPAGEAAHPPAPAPTAGPSVARQARRILLVEDHTMTANALSYLLARRNYDVTTVNCLADAREAAARESFDLLISDLGLPDGNGCELMAELRDQGTLTGIALTGYGMEDDIKRSLAAGFKAHLTKPVSIHSLDSALASVHRTLGERGPAPKAEPPVGA